MKEIAIVGYSGKMSQAIAEVLNKDSISFGFFSEKSPSHERITDLSQARAIIDFSTPESSFKILEECVRLKKPLVCGTTGWKSLEEAAQRYREAGQSIPVVLDSNFSAGIELLCQAVERITPKITKDIWITDIHHQHKKDAPSGTAKKIAARINSCSDHPPVHFKDYRIGEHTGEHTVHFDLGDEVIEIRHLTFSRRVFAAGAVRAWRWMRGKESGFFTMKEVLQ